MVKKIGLFIFAILLLSSFFTPVAAEDKVINIFFFHAEGCLYCAKEEVFLKELQQNDKNIKIYRFEIAYDKEGQEVAKKVEDLLGIKISTVPYTIIGRQSIIGFSEGITDKDILEAIAYNRTHVVRDIVGEMLGVAVPITGDEDDPKETIIRLPFFGEVKAKSVSLPLLAVVIGTLDGFNPCAMWVLLLLISMLIHIKEKWKMWTLGFIFLFTSAIMYFFFMLSWLNITMLFGSVFILRLIIGVVAVGGGSINIRNGLKKDDGCEVVDSAQRKKLRQRIQEISDQPTFILAILGIMGLAITVNLVELLCSAGLPIVFTQVLALNQVTYWEKIGYLLLYVSFFLLDDIIVFVIAMKTFELTGISTKYAKYSHLIGGAIMIILGILMVVKPGWLMFNFS
jgi:thiol-disulfide isomerase/thioredoxin